MGSITITKVLFACWVILYFISCISAKPTWRQGDPIDSMCKQNEIEELCQVCAKKTKSIIVYPMCCSNEEDVTSWCKEYTQFGYP